MDDSSVYTLLVLDRGTKVRKYRRNKWTMMTVMWSLPVIWFMLIQLKIVTPPVVRLYFILLVLNQKSVSCYVWRSRSVLQRYQSVVKTHVSFLLEGINYIPYLSANAVTFKSRLMSSKISISRTKLSAVLPQIHIKRVCWCMFFLGLLWLEKRARKIIFSNRWSKIGYY